jgi:hypothetical protein
MLAVYLFAVPLALILGFLATSPGEVTFMLVGILVFCLALPLILKWHHGLLVIFWSSAFGLFFLPGQPSLWLVLAALSFGVSFLDYVMGRRPFLPAPEMIRPLIFLVLVVLGTAWYRGGVGIKALGGAANGGKNYVYIFAAIFGYFALTAGQIALNKSRRMAGLYFLSGTSFALSNLAYALGPAFYVFYYLVPSDAAIGQAASDFGVNDIDRIQGLGEAGVAAFCFLLVMYGIRGLFNVLKPWRFSFLCLVVGVSFFSGFRSILVLLALIFAFQFYFEGLFRTRMVLVMGGLFTCLFLSVILFSSQMPLSVQRAISFLPVSVDSSVRADAMGSTDWRMQMWSIVWREVPKYFIVGKGYSIDPTEMFLTQEAIKGGILGSYEEALLAGDYHSGPLSILIPFGIFGVLAFLWVLYAGFRVLYSNYQYGDDKLRRINSVILSYYLAYVVSFFFVFGAFNSQLCVFLGAVGLSVSLNGGVQRKPSRAQWTRTSKQPAFAKELGA